MPFPCGFFPLASPQVRSNDQFHSRCRFVICLCWIKLLSSVFSYPIRLKSPSYLFFFHRPPLCAENFRFSEVMRQVGYYFCTGRQKFRKCFFGTYLQFRRSQNNVYTFKFPFSLREKSDCDLIRTLLVAKIQLILLEMVDSGVNEVLLLNCKIYGPCDWDWGSRAEPIWPYSEIKLNIYQSGGK